MNPAASTRAALRSVLIAGGGTGGHLFPGLAVAEEVRRREPGAQVVFAGTSRGLEARAVPVAGYPLDLIRSAGLKGKSIGARVRGAGTIPLSLVDAWRVLSRRRPRIVIGVGGYSSGPVVLVAALRGIPTLVLEQNATPGLTNRLLSRWVRAAAVTYDAALPHFRGKGFVAGNPVRAEFVAAGATVRVTPFPSVLVLGGSQGAHAVNVAMAAAAPALLRRWTALTLVHQTGERDAALVRDAYDRSGVRAHVAPFLDDVALRMRDADLVVGRAGATSLAELAAIGRAALLVPFPAATDDHQRRNAEVLVAAGAARMIEQRDLTADRLTAAIDELLGDRAALEAMGRAMRGFARPHAAADIVDRMMELVGA
jgi:UDP-N-acetylglucosamine--N-acetylmuramyl-(pentapeptide) pyrophosphoryl-undecaprenol N-acetylglucosamine transferase